MSEPEAIGHVVLNVSDVERSVQFYRDLIGFKVSYRAGPNMAFLTCGKVHHDLALFKAPAGARAYEQGQVGLHHFAFQLKSYEALQDAYRRLAAAGTEITGTVDFGFMRTVSVADPDGIRLELFANTYATDEEGLAAISSQGAPSGPSPTYDPLGPEPPAPKIPAEASPRMTRST